MGHKSKDRVETSTTAAIDPNLAALFDSSLPVVQPKRNETAKSRKPLQQDDVESGESDSPDDASTDEASSAGEVSPEPAPLKKASKKRKHGADDDVEGAYMQRLAREQEREDDRRKRAKQTSTKEGASDDDEGGSAPSQDGESASDDDFVVPQHESLAAEKPNAEIEKATRTVFLGNVSNECIKSKSSRRQLMEHLGSFLADLQESGTKHEVESLRFRSTAYATGSVPKKAAFARKELMDATTQSTNAYAVYSTALAARESVKRLNATMILGRHLRVDSVAHPAQVDHRRCVFVGNLGFVDDESNIRAAQEGEEKQKPKKGKPAADVEEGLWRTFGGAGVVESVRVPRDQTTRVGKGFAYVQFKDPNSVEKALQYNDKKFPPLLPRKLRVTRAKNIKKTSTYSNKETKKSFGAKDRVFNPKSSSESHSTAGRAGKLLGRAGAAQARRPSTVQGVQRSPEDIVFEGHRARGNQGKGTIFGKAKKQGKPANRSSRRGAAYKASGKKQ